MRKFSDTDEGQSGSAVRVREIHSPGAAAFEASLGELILPSSTYNSRLDTGSLRLRITRAGFVIRARTWTG